MTQHTDHATWVSFSTEEMATLRRLLAYVEENTDRDTEIGLIRAKLDKYENPAAKDQNYRAAAEKLSWVREGECEIDDYAVVSGSDDGAYVMSWVWVDRVAAGIIHTARCDNCMWNGDVGELNPIKDLEARLDPGGVVPAGECPECGCLAYETEEDDEEGVQLVDEPCPVNRRPKSACLDECDHGA